jgi:hypothetical protein
VDSVELFPTLEHCVESAAREEFWRLVNRYLEERGGDSKLQERIELLRAFLESTDFGRLRSESEAYLVRGERARFVICWKEGQPYCRMAVVEGA